MRYQYHDQSYDIDLHPRPDGQFEARVNGETLLVSAKPLPDGGWLLQSDTYQAVVYVTTQGATRQVWVNGETYTLTLPAPTQRGKRKGGGIDESALSAQMPGVVVQVAVSVGDAVTQGQTLLTLEAMKMELRLVAPADGLIGAILVKAGDVVERGQVLVKMG